MTVNSTFSFGLVGASSSLPQEVHNTNTQFEDFHNYDVYRLYIIDAKNAKRLRFTLLN
jgi:hypothetical protein